jgi:hypothetical protein
VIGIDDYASPSRWQKLNYAANDAKAVADFLASQGFGVIALYNSDATKTAIISSMQDVLARKLGKDDRFIFLFCWTRTY